MWLEEVAAGGGSRLDVSRGAFIMVWRVLE